MGLLTTSSIEPSGVFAIWHVTEPLSFFEDQIILFDEEISETENLPPKRRSEWFSTRYLLHKLSNAAERKPCLKDRFGKPYLRNFEQYISISHSGEYAAAIQSPVPAGIDIQLMNSNILRISHKFMNETELKFQPETNNSDYCFMIWSAKEAMYKAYGKKEIDFKEHFTVAVPEYKSGEMFFEGEFRKGNISICYRLFCKQFDQLMMVYAVQQ